LESEASAVRRNATVYAEVLGYGSTSDAYHITGPDPEGNGASMSMKLACSEAAQDEGCLLEVIESVGYINTHGTSTPLGDPAETLAIKKAFASPPPISSTKSMTGHLLGAAGGAETAFTALAIKHGLLPPTINYKEPDPECDLDCVPNKARPANIRMALSNSFGFGGHNASILLGKVD
jgi:3-oxoacyl-[acyl-carrier-protein] synthase II